MKMWRSTGVVLAIVFGLAFQLGAVAANRKPIRTKSTKTVKGSEDRMSNMGRLAKHAQTFLSTHGVTGLAAAKNAAQAGDTCVNEPDCEGEDDPNNASGGQAELSIAVDSTGHHVVVGFNDTRGFGLNPISVSGFAYSDDGGETFTDGGQLPSPGTDNLGSTLYPQVFGDPEIKYLGACNFVYASIMVKKYTATGVAQTMSVHRSSDCGHTWTGPFEVTAATNPNGLVTAGGSAVDAADKEYMDVDPDTGRVILSWSNFTPVSLGGVAITTTYSDDILSATPTWSTGAVVAAGTDDGQSSIPRFAGNGSSNAYVAWRRFPSFYFNNVGFGRSTDNGATWSASQVTPDFFTIDQILGNDRVNTSPGLAVDNSTGPNNGNVYLVYSDNDNQDGADILFQRSTDQGQTFSSPINLSARPGNDRAQWFPWVNVDNSTGRVFVFFYDQGVATSGDLSSVQFTYSDDGGSTWSPERRMLQSPFHAGWGNDTGQPNLGDYIQAVAQNGTYYAAFAVASRPPAGFVDGEPTSASFTTPDFQVRRVKSTDVVYKEPTLAVAGVTATDQTASAYLDPGDKVSIKVALQNYVTNPLNAGSVAIVSTALASATPGVTVSQPYSNYAVLAPGAQANNKTNYVVKLASTFVPGTPIDFALTVNAYGGKRIVLNFSQATGTPHTTTLLAENFDSVAAGSLPAGWTTAHGGGANIVRWTTSASFCSASSNAAFHINAEDGPVGGSPTRFERLFSPLFAVPASAQDVYVDFDICYDTEDDPNFNILAYDGALLRVTDFTSGHILRSVLPEAFEDELTTGNAQHMTKHFPRSGNSAYFQDMSAWAGFSNGWKHVHMRLPGMAGTTDQLRFEYTQDGGGICSDVRPGHSCGVAVDNVVVTGVTY